jgi:glycosyltransferase involved in cell wall biosynthesis
MNILHVISSVNPAGGGPIESLTRVAEIMARDGHSTDVLSLDAPGASWLDNLPFAVHALGPGTGTYGYTPALVPWLRDHASRYDVVVVRGIWQYTSFACWRALRNSSTPYVVFTHGMLDPWFKRTYPLKHLKKLMYWPWAEYRVLRDAAAVLFTCEEERILARQSFWLYRCNEVVVNYGTVAPAAEREAQKSAFFALHPNLKGKRIALFLGRIHTKKGCDLLIEAFSQVLAQDPNWHLVIAGPDQIGWQSKLIELARQKGVEHLISWPGMISGDVKYGAIKAAEVFVLPSHQENFGIAVAEALACGTPVLISEKVNIWREVQQDGAGIVASDDLAGTRSMFLSWIEMSQQQRTTMRERALSCFQHRFHIEKAAESLVRVLANARDRHQLAMKTSATLGFTSH